MHVLVTGVGGFSGAVIARALLGRGHRVTAVIGSNPGGLPVGAPDSEGLEILAGDLAGEMMLPRQIDAIVHAAARSPGPGVTPDKMVRDNIFATRRLVNHACQSGVQAFIYCSSLSVYGRIDSPVVDERTSLVDPDIYGLTKRIGEILLAECQGTAMRSLAIRLPGVIGRGSVRNWLTSVLARARDGSDIPVFNQDEPFNNAAHVDDLACFVGDLLGRNWTGFDVVTIGAAGDIPVGDAARIVAEAFGGRSRVISTPSVKKSFLVSSERASRLYGYKPMHIREMIARFATENHDL